MNDEEKTTDRPVTEEELLEIMMDIRGVLCRREAVSKAMRKVYKEHGGQYANELFFRCIKEGEEGDWVAIGKNGGRGLAVGGTACLRSGEWVNVFYMESGDVFFNMDDLVKAIDRIVELAPY